MKGEHVEEQDLHQPNSMFSKLHQTHKFQQSFHPSPNPTLHPFQSAREYPTSEEADSRRSSATPSTTAAASGDGATIEIIRRPRGRPPGSRNKPKPPVIITREPQPSMSPYILELPGGSDVVESVTRFCRKRNTSLCVLTGSGAVANITLRQPSTTPGATVTFHGRFDILSLSATILQATAAMVPPAANGHFTISLAGPQGGIVGGIVVGPLLAAGTVYLIAASFNNPSFHRLPMEEEVRNSGGSGEGQSPSAVSVGGGDGGHTPAATGEGSCGMSIYGSHLGSDVIWAPTARQPPPHY